MTSSDTPITTAITSTNPWFVDERLFDKNGTIPALAKLKTSDGRPVYDMTNPNRPVIQIARYYYGFSGMPLKAGLFVELQALSKSEKGPFFTLKETCYNGYPSLKEVFLNFEDPTEYEFATSVFGSWDLWETLCNDFKHTKDIIAKWRRELDIRMRAKGISRIKDLSDNSPNDNIALSASKFLAEAGWDSSKGSGTGKGSKGRGRPSKEELEGELRRRAEEEAKVRAQAELVLVGASSEGVN